MKHASRTGGFTLLELSVVIVIIGLIVGGILAGQTLVRSAEMNAVVSEFRKYSTAMGGFRDKYSTLPGDMSTAVSYWGNTITGNGDGDGRIENTATAIGAAGALTSNEISNFWIHLSSAGFIEGSFTAVANVTLTPGTNNPRSRLSGGAWNVAYLGTVGVNGQSTPVAGTVTPAASSTTFFAGTYENALLFGSGTTAMATTGTFPTGVMKAEEALNIDSKIDDSKPDSGDVLSLEGQGENDNTRCSNLDTSTSALAASSYVGTSTSTTACSLVFKSGY